MIPVRFKQNSSLFEARFRLNNDEVLIRTFETIKTELKVNWNTE
jgi:hypothetical protein